MSKGGSLRRLLAEKPFIVTPGITNALHALIVEKAGFDYVYVGGYDVSLALLGLPDVGLITETEMVANARNIAGAVNLPVVADADTGYGNAINVIRTVRDYEAAGVAAIHIEDQVSPKRCGHVAGKNSRQPMQRISGALPKACTRNSPGSRCTSTIPQISGGMNRRSRSKIWPLWVIRRYTCLWQRCARG